MARSGSYSFNLTRNKIIRRAFQLLNIYDINATISADDLSYASDILNSLIKSWEAEGINLWKRRQATVFTANATHSYALGATGTHTTNSYINTTISANEALGQTTLSITSSTGMTAGDFIGIELDNGTRQWTTIASVPNGTSVIINVALTAASAANNTIVSYTNKINRPLRVFRATRQDLVTLTEIPLQNIGYDEYFDMPIKNTAGEPNNFYYDKVLDNGNLYVFPEPNNVQTVINITYQDSIQDMNSANDDMDFPQEWTWNIVVNLAVELGYAYGKLIELEKFEMKALALKEQMKAFDSDEESLILTINPSNQRRY